MAVASLTLASCMDDGYGTPSEDEIFFGNDTLTENNVVSIAELKKMCAGEIESQGLFKVEKPMQVKVRVSANDRGGNFYTQFAAQDATGGILIGVGQGGLYGILPQGQEMLIELKDLYIGSYRKQAQIGMPYTNSKGEIGIGKIHRAVWNDHFRLIGKADESKVQPEEFDKNRMKDKDYLKANSGKLMVIRDVEIEKEPWTNVFVPDFADEEGKKPFELYGNAANRKIKGYSDRQIVVRISKYAKFAKEVIPEGKVDITGIFTRYQDTWQIMLRTADDVKPITTM